VIRIEWFGYKIIGSFLHRLDGAFDGSEGGNHDHRDVLPSPANFRKDFQPVHARHRYIEKHELGILPVEGFEAFSAAFRDQDLIPHGFETIPQDLAGVGVVVYDQDSTGYSFHDDSYKDTLRTF
jgi:hypothetical protein